MARSPTTPDVTETGSPPSSLGHPGPRWDGDGSLGSPPREAPAAAGRAAEPLRSPASEEAGPEYASFLRRAASFLLDELGKTLIWITIIVVITPLTGGVVETPSDSVDILALLPRVLLSVGYDWIFWTQGWTPGAVVMQIRIVDLEGRAPGPGRAAIRVAGSVLSAAAFFVGYAWMFRSRRRQTWHDVLAGTVVTRTPRDERRN